MTDQQAPLCFIDTETTGVHPGREVWEVAMIRRDEAGQKETSFFVNVDLRNADLFGLKIGRFYERHPAGQYLAGRDIVDAAATFSRGQAAEEVARFTHEAHLVGAVPNFDAETLAPLLREWGHVPAWHYHLVDVEALAVGYLAGRWAQAAADGHPAEPGPFNGVPWKSDELTRACGVEPASDAERHTALGDALWAMRLYDAITRGTAAVA